MPFRSPRRGRSRLSRPPFHSFRLCANPPMRIFRSESGKAGMEEIGINSPGELEAWLKDKPVEWARVIAHRAAMRVLPLVAEEWKSDRPFERKQALTLALFRANLVARAACYRPNVEMEPFLRASADLADAAHDALAVAYAAAFAAISAFESVSAKAAIQAVDAATFQVSDAAVLWRAVSMDAQWLAAIGKPTQNNFRNLLHEKLWLSRDSAWGVYNLRELRIALMENLEIDDLKGGKIGGWAPLLNWYRQVSFFIIINVYVIRGEENLHSGGYVVRWKKIICFGYPCFSGISFIY